MGVTGSAGRELDRAPRPARRCSAPPRRSDRLAAGALRRGGRGAGDERHAAARSRDLARSSPWASRSSRSSISASSPSSRRPWGPSANSRSSSASDSALDALPVRLLGQVGQERREAHRRPLRVAPQQPRDRIELVAEPPDHPRSLVPVGRGDAGKALFEPLSGVRALPGHRHGELQGLAGGARRRSAPAAPRTRASTATRSTP